MKRIDGEKLLDLIHRDIDENVLIGASESSWVIGEIDGFVVEVKLSELDYWKDENYDDEPDVYYAKGVLLDA